MAEHRYEIVIKNETAKQQKSPVAGSSSGGVNNTPQEGDGTGSNAQTIAKGLVAYNHYAKPFVDRIINFEIGTTELRTGAAELQQRMSFANSVAQKAVGLIESTLIGAAIGGGLPGALIGATMNITTNLVDLMQRQQRLGLERTVENVALGFANTRAGGSVASYSQSRLKSQ